MLEVSCLPLDPVARSVSPKHFSDSELKVLESCLLKEEGSRKLC